MKIIKEIKIVGAKTQERLEGLIKETIRNFQDKGYVVEIQFTANNGQALALIIGRRE